MFAIESAKPILTVIEDDGDLVISSTGPRGKEMMQAVIARAGEVQKLVVISDGEMKVMKKTAVSNSASTVPRQLADLQGDGRTSVAALEGVKQSLAGRAEQAERAESSPSDIQDQFAADLASGLTGESAMGELPSPTPGPSDPVKIPAAPPRRRQPQIFQDAAAPPAPELAEQEMARLLEEAAQAEQEEARVREDRRYQSQQAVQAGANPASLDPASDLAPASAEEPAPSPAAPRRRQREPRQLATTGRPCGRCQGGGQIVGEAGFAGACPVCHGEGQVKTWDRALKVR